MGGGVGFRSTGLDDKLIVLGQKRNNPYSVANMTTAWNNLYDPDYTELPATHLYVRFLPQDMEDLKILYDLEDSLNLDFDDYPLEYEILEDGDHYHDPSIPEDQPTWLYTVVAPDFVFPNIQYEILEQVILAPYYSVLTAEAFRITGNEYDDTGWESVICLEGCPAWLCCIFEPLTCESPCENPPCTPDSPNWPECLGIDPPDPPTITNDCGCLIPGDPKISAGCIRVDDTQLGPEGVRHLKIVVKDGFLQRIVTQSDDQGCWKVNKRHGGRVKVKIKFQNDKAKFRAIRQLSHFWQYGQVLKHKIVSQNPPYNDISVLYIQDSDMESKARARWYAATGNNALHEFYEFANQDGILVPPNKLDVLLTPSESGEVTLMLDEINNSPSNWYTQAQLLYLLVGDNPLFLPVASVFIAYINIWAPDIVYNHGAETKKSDNVKKSYYHEFAHASHFRALDNDSYWINNGWYIAGNWVTNTNPPYGDGTAPGAERCAVIEMWAYHMDPIYADRQYGVNHSNGGVLPQDVVANMRWFN
ncbi:MAG: hypothetical protein ACE5D7_07630 [Fidelibacterota bacterium]